MTKVHVIGEPFDRDDNGFGAIFRITDKAKHDKATRLAVSQWGNIKAYDTLEAIKAAILAA